MGAMQNNGAEKKSRGAVNNKKRLEGFGTGTQKSAGKADWGAATPEWVAAVVRIASSQGIEVSFALTRDKGAHGLKLYDYSTGERVQLWFNGDADLDAELSKVYAQLEAVAG